MGSTYNISLSSYEVRTLLIRIGVSLILIVYAIITLYQDTVIHRVQCSAAYPIINMKLYVLFALLIHATTATIEIQKLKDTAATKLDTITNAAATKLQSLTESASTTLHQFVDTIDFDKVQKLDVLGILPKLQYKGKLIKDTYEHIPEYSEKVKFYLQSIKGLTKKDLLLAFEAPWPAKRGMVVEGYY